MIPLPPRRNFTPVPLSWFEFGDGDGGTAAVVGFGVDSIDERVRGEEFGEAAAEGAGAVSVDDADAGLAGEGSFVEKFIDAAGRFFDGGADDVDFVGGGFVAGLCMDGDIAGAGGSGVGPRLCGGGRFGFEADDIGERDAHTKRAGFDFGAAAVVAAENKRLLVAFHGDTGAGGERGGLDRLERGFDLRA